MLHNLCKIVTISGGSWFNIQSSVASLLLYNNVCVVHFPLIESYNILKIHHIAYELIFGYINCSVGLREVKFCDRHIFHPEIQSLSCCEALKNDCKVLSRHGMKK